MQLRLDGPMRPGGKTKFQTVSEQQLNKALEGSQAIPFKHVVVWGKVTFSHK